MSRLPSIWTESPCSIHFENKFPTFDHTRRFQINSIYHRDDPFKPAKTIDETLCPDGILRSFRKQIKDAGKSTLKERLQRKSPSKHSPSSLSNSATITPEAINVSKRLYGDKHETLSLSRDFFGNRSSFFQKDEKQLLKISNNSNSNPKKHVRKITLEYSHMTGSNRIELSRPMNFNPGPGSYFSNQSISDDLSASKSAWSSKESVTKLTKNKGRPKLASIFEESKALLNK